MLGYWYRICLIFLLIFLINVGCEREDPFDLGSVDCLECYPDKPTYVLLNAVITINDQNPSVPIEVYVGNFEEGNLDWQDTAYQKDYWVEVLPDRYYSVRAEYKDGSKTIYAVDGDKVKLKFTDSNCDVSCYYQTGGYVDIRLRN